MKFHISMFETAGRPRPTPASYATYDCDALMAAAGAAFEAASPSVELIEILSQDDSIRAVWVRDGSSWKRDDDA